MEVPLFLAAEALAEEVASAEALVAGLVVVAAQAVAFSERLISVGDFGVMLLILLPHLPLVNCGAKSKPSLELASHKSPAI